LSLKYCLLILTTLLTIPATAWAHAEIFFPKLFSPEELPTSGFVLLNPDPVTASVNIHFLSASGVNPATGAGILATKTVTIQAGGQLAQLGSDLFPGMASAGWVYALTADPEGMQAFWLTYNGSLTSLDGADAAGYDTIGEDQIIPLAAGQTELNIINPNFLNVPVTIRLFGANGQMGPTITRTLPNAGAFQAQVPGLFGSVDMAEARYLRITSTGAKIASSAVIRGYLVPEESLVVNGVNVSGGTNLTFPHVINGSLGAANYTTVLGITNMSPSSQIVSVEFHPDSGSAITAERTLPGGASLRETAASLFVLPADFRSGWVRVVGSAAVAGFAAYADSVGGGLAVVPPGTAQTKFFFSHIANGPPQWQTGIALVNASASPAAVDVFALTPSGSLLGGSNISLDPGRKAARVLDELIPQTSGVNAGFVFVSSNVPIQGIQLFYTRDLKVLSNVAAGKLVPGVAYVPPTP
jgi:hypothetical protein